MEIFNHTRLLPDITVEKIKDGFSNPPNSVIAEACYRRGLIEKWGRGVPGMIESCESARVQAPDFEVDQIEFKVVFDFPSSIAPPVLDVVCSELEAAGEEYSEIAEILKVHGPA